ncbi:MAG: ferrochelatase [Rhodobacteraceae bacterium]|nr:ferrochelatase [Paracoccaceae bacterium]
MKKLALAAVLTAAASTAFAGSYAKDDVVMEPAVVEVETAASSSAAGIVIPLVMLALVLAVASD